MSAVFDILIEDLNLMREDDQLWLATVIVELTAELIPSHQLLGDAERRFWSNRPRRDAAA